MEPLPFESVVARRTGPSRERVLAARAVAVLADLIQVAAFPVTAEGAISPVDDGIDVLAAVVLTLLVGPHIAFIPSFAVKLLPVADLAPTWTVAVLIATGGQGGRPTAELPGPLAPVPTLAAADPGRRRIGRSARMRAVAWFGLVFVTGFAVGGLYLMPHLWPVAGNHQPPSAFGNWQQNWAGAILGGGLGLLAARTVLRRAGAA